MRIQLCFGHENDAFRFFFDMSVTENVPINALGTNRHFSVSGAWAVQFFLIVFVRLGGLQVLLNLKGALFLDFLLFKGFLLFHFFLSCLIFKLVFAE